MSGPMARAARERRVCLGAETCDLRVEFGDLGGERLVSVG